MNSPGHRANILSRVFREIGVGFSAGTPEAGAPGGIYTTDFGLARRLSARRYIALRAGEV